MEQVQLEQWLAVTHQERIVLLVFLSQSNIAYCTITVLPKYSLTAFCIQTFWICIKPLEISALDSRLSGPGSSTGWGHCVVLWGKTLYYHSASLQLAVQGVGSSNTPSCFMLRKPQLSAGPLGHLGLYKGFSLPRHQRLHFFPVWYRQTDELSIPCKQILKHYSNQFPCSFFIHLEENYSNLPVVWFVLFYLKR